MEMRVTSIDKRYSTKSCCIIVDLDEISLTNVTITSVGKGNKDVNNVVSTRCYLHNEVDVVRFIVKTIQEDLVAVPQNEHFANKPQ